MTRPVDPDYIADALVQLVSVDTTNPDLVSGGVGESPLVPVLESLFDNLGLKTEIQEVAPGRVNIIGRWVGKGGGRSILLTGHMDVVGTENMTIAPFTPEIKGGKLFGRGSYDMKGGLAAILGAVEALRRGSFQPAGDIILGFVCDEEYASIGTSALVKTVQANAAILTEPTGGDLCVAHRGFAWLTIIVQGKAAHGSLYNQGIDAITHMGRVLRTLETIDAEVYSLRSHPLLGRASVHASLIDGGLGWSTYPDACTLKIEHRLLPDENAENVLVAWTDALADLHKVDPTFKATVGLDMARPGYEIAEDAPIVQTLYNAHVSTLKRSPDFVGQPAWLDSAILGAAGIPTVILGPAGDGAHAAVEWVDLASVTDCAAVVAEAAASWTGRA